jgi:osmoprotectant transport system permease protein
MTPRDLVTWIEGHQAILTRTVGEHVVLSAVALAAIVSIGVPLGIALTRWRRAETPVLVLVTTLRAVPSLALLAVMLPVLGTGFLPSAIALAIYGLPAVLLNTHTGLREVAPDIVEAGRGQGFSERQILLRIAIPLALPLIFAGIRTSAVQVVSAATLAVFIGGGGLGELISAGMGLLDISQLVIGAFAVATLALLTELSFGAAERAAAAAIGSSRA